MSEVVNGNLKDILGAIKEVQEKNIYPVFIPSLQKNVMFREMNTKQEKMIVKTIVDNPVYNSEFIFAIRAIIKENCADELDIDALTLIDKTAICLVMRMKSIGNEFEYTFGDSKKKITINIADYVEKYKEIIIPEDEVVGTDSIKVTCSYPTIKTEYDLEHEFRSGLKELQIDNLEEARSAIGTVFTNELVKYIKNISIFKPEGEMVLDMSSYNFKTREVILEELGNSVIASVINYIERANKEVRSKLAIELELTGDDVKELKTDKLTSILETGSDFFMIS